MYSVTHLEPSGATAWPDCQMEELSTNDVKHESLPSKLLVMDELQMAITDLD